MERKTTSNKYYETILDWFKAQLIAGKLREGDLIPSERELASQFGVSRVPVREALRILEYVGIIANTAAGMTVQRVDIQLLSPKANFGSEITMETIENLFEVRIFLESAAAYYAARRRDDEDIRRLHESVQEMSAALESPEQSRESLIQASHEFHFHVIHAAKNPVLENMYRNLYDLLQISKQYTISAEQVSGSTLMEHEAILYKIEKGDCEEASKYMKFHLSRAQKKLEQEETLD